MFVIILLLVELLSYIYTYVCMYMYAYCLIKNSFVRPTAMHAIYLQFQMDVFMSKIINMP
jgi:hypothetical protein